MLLQRTAPSSGPKDLHLGHCSLIPNPSSLIPDPYRPVIFLLLRPVNCIHMSRLRKMAR